MKNRCLNTQFLTVPRPLPKIDFSIPYNSAQPFDFSITIRYPPSALCPLKKPHHTPLEVFF